MAPRGPEDHANALAERMREAAAGTHVEYFLITSIKGPRIVSRSVV